MTKNPLLSAEYRQQQKAICEAASPELLVAQQYGSIWCTGKLHKANDAFMCSAREHYPAALDLLGQQAKALAAKDAELKRLRANQRPSIKSLAAKHGFPEPTETGAEAAVRLGLSAPPPFEEDLMGPDEVDGRVHDEFPGWCKGDAT